LILFIISVILCKSLRLGNQETSDVVQIYIDPKGKEMSKELFSNMVSIL
jgi:hypothetical protein